MQLTKSAFPDVALHQVPDYVPAHVLAAVALPIVQPNASNAGREGVGPDSNQREIIAHETGMPSPATSNELHRTQIHSSELDVLHIDERALARELLPSRRAAFVAGRVALRAAAGAVQPHAEHSSMLRSPRGAPMLPPGLAASVSHKRHVAVALASNTQDPRITLGVDIEDIPQQKDLFRPDIGTRILTPREHAHIATLDAIEYRHATVVRFALKEAIYKAIDPRVQRYVGFTEVEVDVHESGAAQVTLLLPEFSHGELDVRAAWWTIGSHILAAVAIKDLR